MLWLQISFHDLVELKNRYRIICITCNLQIGIKSISGIQLLLGYEYKSDKRNVKYLDITLYLSFNNYFLNLQSLE